MLPFIRGGRFLKTDSKTLAVILLRCLRDFLLRCYCRVRADLLHLSRLL